MLKAARKVLWKTKQCSVSPKHVYTLTFLCFRLVITCLLELNKRFYAGFTCVCKKTKFPPVYEILRVKVRVF